MRVAALVAVLTMPASVHAQTSAGAAGDEALARARGAWDASDYDVAEPLYRQAIEQGGLAPADVLDAYVHLGATRAVLGKKASALAAFKAAALIDARFVVPPEAGRKAVMLAEQARRAEGQAGGINMHAEMPSTIAAGESADVTATLDAAHARLASRIALLARDPMTNKSYEDASDGAPLVHFKVPGSLALPSATLLVRIDALDGHKNRLASVEQRVHVKAAEHGLPAIGSVAGRTGPGGALAVNDAASQRAADEHTGSKSGGFWSTAWPYVLGGAALAAGGAAVYFATRPGDDVNVGAVHVQLQH